jgi:Uma2 family endonuclease
MEIGARVREYVRKLRLGVVMAESGIRTERTPDSVRGPDVSYMSNARFSKAGEATGYSDVAPELCIEVTSPGDSGARLEEKAAEYLAAGVLLVWIVDGERREVRVYSTSSSVETLDVNAVLTGGDVLPGFELSLSEFFACLDGN